MSKSGGDRGGSSPGRSPNDDRSDSMNRQTDAGRAAAANHDRQVAANKDEDEDDE